MLENKAKAKSVTEDMPGFDRFYSFQDGKMPQASLINLGEE